MRVYPNLIQKNLALFDQPRINYGQIKIFKQLLVCDQLPDDDFGQVLEEAGRTALMVDPSFSIFFDSSFKKYIEDNRHHARWQKIKQDYNYYTEWETKRRNKTNPYFPLRPNFVSEWEDLPDPSREKKNQPYQFDPLYKDSQTLAREVGELTKDYKKLKDKDLFRAKVNSILVPNKIVFALNSNDTVEDFAQSEIALVNIKLSMDAFKLADMFLNRMVSSLYKIKWNYTEIQKSTEKCIELSESISHRLKQRIVQLEKAFILYSEADLQEE